MIVSRHAMDELRRRNIPREVFETVLSNPEQKVPEHGTVMCYQSRVTISGKRYLLRIMVDETRDPPVVVTVYRTGKIDKYWRME